MSVAGSPAHPRAMSQLMSTISYSASAAGRAAGGPTPGAEARVDVGFKLHADEDVLYGVEVLEHGDIDVTREVLLLGETTMAGPSMSTSKVVWNDPSRP